MRGKYSTYRTYRPGVSQPLLRGKLQGLTSKSKVHRRNQNVSRTPNKNHWTPHSCDEEKQWRLQSQHNFLLFFPQTYMFCPFASPSLRNAVKETSSGITAGRHIHNPTFFLFFFFFFPSGGYQLMSSKCPPRNSSAGVEDCFAEEVKGVTTSHR